MKSKAMVHYSGKEVFEQAGPLPYHAILTNHMCPITRKVLTHP